MTTKELIEINLYLLDLLEILEISTAYSVQVNSYKASIQCKNDSRIFKLLNDDDNFDYKFMITNELYKYHIFTLRNDLYDFEIVMEF